MRYSESRLMLSLDNVIIRLMESHFKVPFTKSNLIETTGYCYHSVFVITFGLAQSDHIKRLLLYIEGIRIDRVTILKKTSVKIRQEITFLVIFQTL